MVPRPSGLEERRNRSALMEGAGFAFPIAAELGAIVIDWVFSWLSQGVANMEGISIIIRKQKKELT